MFIVQFFQWIGEQIANIFFPFREKTKKRNLNSLQPEDTLYIPGYTLKLTVVAVWRTRQGPYHWVEYELRPSEIGKRNVWLEVEKDDGVWTATVWDVQITSRDILDIAQDHWPKTVLYQDVEYTLEQEGVGQSQAEGDTAIYDVIYADYIGARSDSTVHSTIQLSIESYEIHGDSTTYTEAWIGHQVSYEMIVESL